MISIVATEKHKHYGNHFDAFGNDFRHSFAHGLSTLEQERINYSILDGISSTCYDRKV